MENATLRMIDADLRVAASGDHIVMLGARPTRIETGYGYIDNMMNGRIDGVVAIQS